MITKLPCLLAGSFVLMWQVAAYADSGFFSRSSSSSKSKASMEERINQLERRADASDNLALLQRIQELEDELQMVYGQLEEQDHTIKLMEQRQRELYVDLDRRLGQATVSQSPSNVESSDHAPMVPSSPSMTQQDAEAEEAAYQTAYQFIRERQYQRATDEFYTFLAEYPDGFYAANAYYWLGELYLVEGDLDNAEQAFQTVLNDFPEHQKTSDALLKLGQVLHARESDAEAQAVFNDVIARYPGTSTARLAEARLQEMKQSQ